MNRTEMILGICKKLGIKVRAVKAGFERTYYKTPKDCCPLNLDSIWCRKEIVEAIHKKICK